jgi:hypothetical protein
MAHVESVAKGKKAGQVMHSAGLFVVLLFRLAYGWPRFSNSDSRPTQISAQYGFRSGRVTLSLGASSAVERA